MSDSENKLEKLAVAVRGGDYSVFSELARLCVYLPENAVTLGNRLGLERDDLYQEALLALLRALHSYDPQKSSFRTYSAACVRRQIYSALRAGLRQKNRALLDYVSFDDLDFVSVDGPESDWIQQEELRDRREKAFSALSPFENAVLGFYLRGLSYREIAEKLGKTEKSIGNALSRVRSKLRPKGTDL